MLFLPTVCWAEDIPADDTPHHFQMTCATCHESVQVPKGPSEMPSDDFGNHPEVGAMYLDINQACTQADCHEFDLSVSHPLGVKPSGKTPSSMPLDQNSRLTCLSCHDELGRSDETLANPHFLRQPPDRNLCASCHQTLGRSIKDKAHWQFTTKAHLVVDNNFSGALFNALTTDAKNIQGIDPESYNCIRCHDGQATILQNDFLLLGSKKNRQNHANHPIGMNYQNKLSRKRAEFQPQRAMNPDIRFVNGQVGCGSCHNMYGNNPKKLAVRNDRDALCKSCHIK